MGACRVALRGFITVSLLVIGARDLIAQNLSPRVARRAVPASCIAPTRTVSQARLDERHLIYTEQEAVAAQPDGRVLVAGNPVFVWKEVGDSHELIVPDSLIGMVIHSPTKVSAVRSPLPGRSLAAFRAAALPDGWWLVTFAEAIVAQRPPFVTILAMWSGETDGVQWRSVEKMPATADSLVSVSISEIVVRGDRALLAVTSRRGDSSRVVLYTRTNGKWSVRSDDVGRRAYVALAATKTHDVMAVVRADSTVAEDDNSLFIYHREQNDTAWVEHQRVVRGFRSPAHDPVFHPDGEGLLLSWRVETLSDGNRHAWFTKLDHRGGTITENVRIASGAVLLYHASRNGRGAWAVVDAGSPSATLQLLEYDGSMRVSAARVSSTQFRGLVGLAIAGDRLVLIAAHSGRFPPNPAALSIIHSHPWRCP